MSSRYDGSRQAAGTSSPSFWYIVQIGFDGRTVLVLVAEVLEQPAADDLVDFRPLDRLADLLDPAQHLLQRFVDPLGAFLEELGELAGQRGDHDGVRAVGDGDR